MDAEDAQKYPGPHVKVDGSVYPLPENWTFEEERWIKRKTALRPGDMLDALRAGDSDFGYAYAAIAMYRDGMPMGQVEQILDKKSSGTIHIDFRDADEQMAEAEGKPVPPAEPAAAGAESKD